MNAPPRRPDGPMTFGFLPSPPPLPRTAARALACCALVQRAEIEPPAGEPLDDDARAGIDDLIELSLDWLERQEMAGELRPAERAALEAKAGELPADSREHYADAGEGAAVIAWALRRAPLPGFDVDADAAAVAAALGWLDEAGATLATTAHLRNREELATYLDAVSAVHWRLRARIEPDSPATGAVSMTRWQVERFAWPEDVTPLALAEDGDLALAGQSICAAPPAALLAALRRIRERHRATLWLLGQARDWDAIDLNL